MSHIRYTARLPFDTIVFLADLSQASAPIYLYAENDNDESLTSTGFQTADARHRLRDALRLVLLACGRLYFYDPSSADSADEQLATLVATARIEAA